LSDLLGAASLLLAVLGILYGLWYREIIKALMMQVPKHEEDKAKPRGEVATMLLSRALPLAVAATLISLVFLPDAIQIASFSVRLVRQVGLGRYIGFYSSVATAFVLVELMAAGIAVHSTILLIKLIALLRRLSASVPAA
jgi:hypothetical protein